MNRLEISDLNMHKILLGGQTFTWDEYPSGDFIGVTQDRAIKLTKDGNTILWQTYPDNDDAEFIHEYFRTDLDTQEIVQILINNGLDMIVADEYRTVRLLRQPVELTILSFILSSNKNIKAIRRTISLLRREYGKKLSVDGTQVDLFPSTERLAELRSGDLKWSGIGYRESYLLGSARKIIDSPHLLESEGEALKADLMTFPGVGPKVADCILSFGYGYDNISPVDVWTKRILTEVFGLRKDLRYEDYSRWISERFDGKGAWIMQVLFEWYRQNEDTRKLTDVTIKPRST